MKVIRKLWPQLALLAVGLIWGSSNVFIKDAVHRIPAAFLIALRCTTACLLLGLIFYKRMRKITRRDLISGAVIGACLFLAYYMQTCSMYFTDPGKCGFLASIYSVIVPFLYWIVAKKRPTTRHLAAAFLCIAGVALCSVTGTLSITWGDSMALISGFFYAAHIVTIEKFGSERDPVVITVLQFGMAGLCGWVVALTTETSRIALPGTAVLDVLYLALVCTGLAMFLQNLGQNRVKPNFASILMSTEALFGVLISVLAGFEMLNSRLIFGFVLIFAAVLVSQVKLPVRQRQASSRSALRTGHTNTM